MYLLFEPYCLCAWIHVLVLTYAGQYARMAVKELAPLPYLRQGLSCSQADKAGQLADQ